MKETTAPETTSLGTIPEPRNDIMLDVSRVHKLELLPEEGGAYDMYMGLIPRYDLERIATDRNVREGYGFRGKRETNVHLRIAETAFKQPSYFAAWNGGYTIVGKKLLMEPSRKRARIVGADLINGAQTQSVLILQNMALAAGRKPIPQHSVPVRIIITEDEKLIEEASRAHNTSVKVEELSLYGSTGMFGILNEHFTRAMVAAGNTTHNELPQEQSETGIEDDDYIVSPPGTKGNNTAKVVQLLFTVMPDEIRGNRTTRAWFGQVKKAMRTYADMWTKLATDSEEGEEAVCLRAQMNFFNDMAAPCWMIFNQLLRHPHFGDLTVKVTQARKPGQKGKARATTEKVVPGEGLVFPMMAGLTFFLRQQKDGHWRFQFPTDFFAEGGGLDAYIEHAVRELERLAAGDQTVFGRDFRTYNGLVDWVKDGKFSGLDWSKTVPYAGYVIPIAKAAGKKATMPLSVRVAVEKAADAEPLKEAKVA